MAMRDTGSSFAEWIELYNHDPSAGLPTTGGAAADSDVIAGAAATAASPPTSGGSGGSPTKALLHGVEGPRVGKPARRRSRASRHAPVTLLNTDTTNFRAMVQQFTGIPAPPAGAPVLNFAGDYGFPPPAGVMSFDHGLYRSGSHAHAPATIQDQLRRQQQHHYTGAAPFGYNSLHGGGGDLFASMEDRMLLQSIQAAQMPPASAVNHGASGFFA